MKLVYTDGESNDCQLSSQVEICQYRPQGLDYTEILTTQTPLKHLTHADDIGTSIAHVNWNGQLQSNALQGLLICCSGVGDMRDAVKIIVETLGGKFSPKMNHMCTHLVIDENGSDKHCAAESFGVTVVTIEWLDNSFVQGKKMNEDDYLPQPFRNCIVCITGIRGKEREQIQILVEKNGGKYQAAMNLDCTHLVSDNVTSQKYKCAVRHGIVTVNRRWIDDKVKFQGAINDLEPKYAVGTDVEEEEESMEEKKDFAHNIGSIADIVQYISHLEVSDKSLTFMYNCVISLLGFQEDYENIFARLICYSGGTRLKFLHPETTHIVIDKGYGNDDEIIRFQSENPGVFIVSAAWVVQCHKNGGILEPKDFSIDVKSRKTTQSKLSYQVGDVTPKKKAAFDFTSLNAPTMESAKLNCLFFSGKTFMIDEFSTGVGQKQNLQNDITAFGGSVISHRRNSSIDYVISSRYPEGHSMLMFEKLVEAFFDSSQELWVTPAWILECQNQRRIVPIYESMRYLVVPSRFKVSRFSSEGVLLTVSQFAGNERDHIGSVCRAFGAKYSEKLRKATTHLIYNHSSQTPIDSNPKIKKAREWNIPIVHFSWLYDCIVCSTLLPTATYEERLVAEVERLHGKSRREALVNNFGNTLQQALGRFGDVCSVAVESSSGSVQNAHERPTVRVENMEADIDISTSMSSNISETQGTGFETPRKCTTWSKVIIYVSRSSRKGFEDILKEIERKGATIRKSLAKHVTHFVCDSSTKTKELETAKERQSQGKLLILTTEWLRKCKEMGYNLIDPAPYRRIDTLKKTRKKRKSSESPTKSKKVKLNALQIQQSDMERINDSDEDDDEVIVYSSTKSSRLLN